MLQIRSKLKSIASGLSATIFIVTLVAEVAFPGGVFALGQPIVSPRSLTLEAGATDGGSKAGGTVKHLYNFTLDNNASSENIGSISFQYCTTGEAVSGGIGCNAPTGVNVSGATLSNDGGALTGFTGLTTSSVDDASDGTVNVITISKAAATNITASTSLVKEFSSIVNPTTANQTFYVRIYAYSATTGGALTPAAATDYGTVAASTANPIVLNGTMPESLVFCTGQSISETNNVPDCSTATAGNISFNALFSSTSTSWATSQMAASTNAGSGYAVTVNGTTMTSGSNTISAVTTAGGDISRPGTSQFGLNLAADTDANAATPAISPSSANVTTPTGNSFYHGQAVAPYATGGVGSAAKYEFVSGDTVANSNSLASDPQVFTSTYLVNVPGHQPAGGYTTTLTYICTATY